MLANPAYIGDFDLDLGLREASLDPGLLPAKRIVAALSLGMDCDDAFYSVRELRQAVSWVHEGIAEGRTKLAALLNARCDDYQRALYYALAGRGIVDMLDTLDWLESQLMKRGKIAGKLSRNRIPRKPLINPYIAPVADGPLVEADPAFSLGPSWSADPCL